MGRAAGSSTKRRESQASFDLSLSFGKMSWDCSLPTMDEISLASYGTWPTSGFTAGGECWMLSTSESPSEGDGYSACFLADVLEPNAAPKYSLSTAACAGILRRAAKRGKAFPGHLQAALEQVASARNGSGIPAGKTP